MKRFKSVSKKKKIQRKIIIFLLEIIISLLIVIFIKNNFKLSESKIKYLTYSYLGKMERKKEIAILKSIGATPKGITFSFLLTGVACGGGGLLLGVPAGILISVFANQLVTGLEKLLNFIVRINYFCFYFFS